MGYAWDPVIQNVTEIAAAHVNQINTNFNSLYTDLELSSYSWAFSPVSVGDQIDFEEWNEFRVAADYADDQNYCRSHDASYNGGDDATARGTVLSGENTGYDAIDDTGVDATYNASVLADEKSGYDATYDSVVDTDEKTIVQNSVDSEVLATNYVNYNNDEHTSVLSSEKSGYDATYNASVDGAADASALSGEKTGYDVSYDAGVDGNYDGSIDSSDYYSYVTTNNSPAHNSYRLNVYFTF